MRLKQLPYKQALKTFDAMGLKVETVYITDPSQYGTHAIYLNRIANYANPKFRILDTGTEHVKNCMKITYNPDRWEKHEVEHLIRTRLRYLAHWSMGSCHKYIRQGTVKETLTAKKI